MLKMVFDFEGKIVLFWIFWMCIEGGLYYSYMFVYSSFIYSNK